MEFIQTLNIQEIDFAVQVNSSIPSRQVESEREREKKGKNYNWYLMFTF